MYCQKTNKTCQPHSKKKKKEEKKKEKKRKAHRTTIKTVKQSVQ